MAAPQVTEKSSADRRALQGRPRLCQADYDAREAANVANGQEIAGYWSRRAQASRMNGTISAIRAELRGACTVARRRRLEAELRPLAVARAVLTAPPAHVAAPPVHRRRPSPCEGSPGAGGAGSCTTRESA